MGSFRGPSGDAVANLQACLLRKMKSIPRSAVLPVNALVNDIRRTMPSCPFSSEELASLIVETAMLLGLVPVFDRSRLSDDEGERGKRHDDPGRRDRDAFKPTQGRSLS